MWEERGGGRGMMGGEGEREKRRVSITTNNKQYISFFVLRLCSPSLSPIGELVFYTLNTSIFNI